MTSLAPPPEAQLIRRRREARVPKLSMREAARRTGISPAYWRMIETGVRRVQGQDFPERASDETLARMARTVGIKPSELAGAGRPEAADLLTKLLAEPTSPTEQLVEDVLNSNLTERQKQAIVEHIRRDTP